MKKILLFLIFSSLIISCKNKQKSLFTLLSATETGIDFQNTIIENEQFNLYDFHNVYNGAGVAIGDINNDNLPDLYFTGNMSGDKVYLNKGDFHFQDITKNSGIIKQGWSTGVTMADVNADGFLDIYVCKSGNYKGPQRANQLYINQGGDKFIESAKQYGLADTTFSSQAAFFDYDKDGDLDLYLLTTTNLIHNPNQISVPINDGTGFSPDKLYENIGNGNGSSPRFVDVSIKEGILHDGNGLGLSICDLNDDGWEDVFVTNDFLPSDLLYINNHNKNGSSPRFTESAKQYFKHHSRFSMGNDVADFNNDGKMDVMMVDMLQSSNEDRKMMTGAGNFQQYETELQTGYHPQFMRNMLHLNLGKTPDGRVLFSEIGQFAGVHATDWSWAPLFADFDNDGLKDLFISNGYLRDITNLDFISYNVGYEQAGKSDLRHYMIDKSLQLPSMKTKNYFFKNKNDLTFENATQKWFGDSLSVSHGASYADLDNDGDLDLVVNNTNQPAFLLRNDCEKTNFLAISLKGSEKNTFGLGSDVSIFNKGQVQKYHQSVTRGYASSVDYKIHFGLGENEKIDSLEIIWTDEKSQKLKNIIANQTLVLDYKNAGIKQKSKETLPKTLLEEITKIVNVNFFHQEERYMDYNSENLLMHKLSQQGPKMAVGDINNDGLEDFFVGGSYNHYGKFFVQTPSGKFIEQAYTKEILPKNEEDVGVLLFDADNDNDQDLYIVSGSNEYVDGSKAYQDRLYFNDGKGSFTNVTSQLPVIRHSGSCVVAADYDQDGDLDIFRGGRLTPLQYPQAGNSYILKNDYGIFSEFTQEVAPELQKTGMVTDAIWADIDNDTWLDLVVVGELMPLTIFKNYKGKLQNINVFSQSDGFWNCISSGDFDKDGDIDFVFGNMGQNSRYQCSLQEPITVYGEDYDSNGRWDAIPSYFLNGKEYPIPMRDDLLRQLPSFRAKFTNYASYAKATMKETLTELQIKQSIIKKAFVQRSMYAENQGNGKFVLKPLPPKAQWSPLQSMLVNDLNRDGNLDIIMVGNAYDAEPIAGRFDASVGLVLAGDGKGNFKELLYDKTGFVADGDCKSIVSLKNSTKNTLFVVSRNDGLLRVFSN